MDRPVEILEEAVQKYLAYTGELQFSGTHGSVNNIVRRVSAQDCTYIVRIYNNGNDKAKVQFEHLILAKLRNIPLSFSVPDAFPSVADGSTYVQLSDGSYASFFHLIPGNPPLLQSMYVIGKACGELTTALQQVSVEQAPPTPPYFEIYKVHHGITRDTFFAEVRSERLDEVRSAADFMIDEVQQIEKLIQSLLDLQLPQQLIHGDLHHDNMLVLEDKVTGVLDFEFCAMDWRAMDLAITLSKYAGEADPMVHFNEVIRGYTSFVTLSEPEIAVIADLIILRILSNVVYFVGRALSGEDKISTLTTRIENYAKRIVWLREHKRDILQCFRQDTHTGA